MLLSLLIWGMQALQSSGQTRTSLATEAGIGKKSLCKALVAQPRLCVQVVEMPCVPQTMVLTSVSEWDRVGAIVLMWEPEWPTHLIPHCLP